MEKENYLLLDEVFTALGFPLRVVEPGCSVKEINLYYRNNPDGTLRWAWPAAQKKPLFLRFYNTSSRRAKLLAMVIRLLFIFRLQFLFASGKMTIQMRPGHFELFTKRMGCSWAIFSGTAGVNRTALVYADNLFYKIPLGEYALGLLINEYRQHRHWKGFRFEHIELATASLTGQVLIQNDVSAGGKRSGRLSGLHWKVIQELSGLNQCMLPLKVMPQWKELDEKLISLQQTCNNNIPKGLVHKLKKLKNTINPETVITACYSHGDFTPWNMYVKENKIALIDWELANTCSPVFTDTFHFLYQQASLVGHTGHTEFKNSLNKAFEHPVAADIRNRNNINLDLHHRLYILFTAVYYLEKYTAQEHWPVQLRWSTAIWSAAVNDFLEQSSVYSLRQMLLTDIFDFLRDKSYAALKWLAAHPDQLQEESDIDLCIDRGSVKEFTRFLQLHPAVQQLRICRKSFMNNYSICLKDHSFLSVDTIWQFRRRHTVMMDAVPLMESVSFTSSGVKVPSAAQDFTYVWLFYLLNNAAIPEKYRQHFSFYSKQWSKELNEKFEWKEILGIRHYREVFRFDPENRKKVMNILEENHCNRGIKKIKNKLLYAADTVRENFFRKGFIITFSGVDGAGKSTVIEKVKQQVEKKFRRKVVVLRHRPALLPMLSAWKEGRREAEKKAAERLPRQGNNSGFLSSLLRFAYYYTDYLVGQFVVQVKYVWRGYVVLYDRYYFDFINDSKRSNIILPNWLTRSWYALLLKPTYNFFLYAGAETILLRKRELDKTTIGELTSKYLALFSRLGKKHRHSKYIAIENEVLPVTMDTIMEHIKIKAI